ncbi:Anoctamin-1 [Cichlidogyrus casuarinus]|uniref:Anoctamin n=1 Tax=Cichlidogyrus casuarinus TaxID=1844966 RepID=A0ABD2Q5Z3_9PLAT
MTVDSCLARQGELKHRQYKDELKREERFKVDDLIYVKLHAPWAVLISFADVLKIRKPIKRIGGYSRIDEQRRNIFSCFNLSTNEVRPVTLAFTAEFQKSKLYLFDIKKDKQDDFFTLSERSFIVDYLLRRAAANSSMSKANKKFYNLLGIKNPHRKWKESLKAAEEGNGKAHSKKKKDTKHNQEENEEDRDSDDDPESWGITKLLEDKVFIASFPLHEASKKYKIDEYTNTRMMLSQHWASYKKLLKSQPLDYVRLYFGETIGFYFAWLEFYTKWLIPPAVVGIISFISGVYTIFDDPLVRA